MSTLTVVPVLDVKLVTTDEMTNDDGSKWIRYTLHTNSGKITTSDSEWFQHQNETVQNVEIEVTDKGYKRVGKFSKAVLKPGTVTIEKTPLGNGLAAVQSAREHLEIVSKKLDLMLALLNDIRSKFA